MKSTPIGTKRKTSQVPARELVIHDLAQIRGGSIDIVTANPKPIGPS